MTAGPEAAAPHSEDVLELYARHGPALLAYGTALLGNRAAAEDVLHQVFLKLLEPGARSPALLLDARPYLFRAVRNTALNAMRGETRELARRQAALPVFEAPPGLEDAARELEAALLELPDEQRQIVVLRLWAEMTIEEAASVVGVPPNTAASRYRYAIAKLRERMRPRQGD